MTPIISKRHDAMSSDTSNSRLKPLLRCVAEDRIVFETSVQHGC